MKRNILWAIGSILLMLILALPSCGNSTPATTKVTNTTTTKTTATIEEPKYGGTITWLDQAANVDVTAWDQYDATSVSLLGLMYENLMAVDWTKGRTGTKKYEYTGRWIAPEMLEGGDGLASSWEQKDPTTVVFKLRPGIMFPAKPPILAAPREMTADDVVFVLTEAAGDKRITAGFRDLFSKATAIDKSTVEIKLKVIGDWRYWIGWGARVMYAPETSKAGLANWKNALGTGPYQVKDYVPGNGIYFDKNPVYWQKDYPINGKKYQLPFADKIVMPIIPDEAAQIAAVRTGKADAIFNVRWLYRDSLAQSSPDLKKWEFASWGCNIIGMREDTAPFTDIRVRQALSAAIDRQAIIKTSFGGAGVMLNSPYPATWPGVYVPMTQLNADTQHAFKYDEKWAKDLLTAAGFPNGFKTEVVFQSSAAASDMLSIIAANWAKIGVTLELKPLEKAVYNGVLVGLTHKQMLMIDESTPTPSDAMQHYVTNGSHNAAMLANKQIDAAVAAANQELDTAKQIKLWNAVGQTVVEDMSYIILPGENGMTYAWPWVKNYAGEIHAKYRGGVMAFKYAWVDQAMKTKLGY